MLNEKYFCKTFIKGSVGSIPGIEIKISGTGIGIGIEIEVRNRNRNWSEE